MLYAAKPWLSFYPLLSFSQTYVFRKEERALPGILLNRRENITSPLNMLYYITFLPIFSLPPLSFAICMSVCVCVCYPIFFFFFFAALVL
jgi:hypothetical protein